MSKKIVSKIKGWEGSVTIADPLLLTQSLALRKAAREETVNFYTEIKKGDKKGEFEMKDGVVFEEILLCRLPSALGCVEEWDIKGRSQPTAETFPFAGTDNDALKAIEFITWLRNEIFALYNKDEADDPNP